MSDAPKVSVAMVTYRHEPFIAEAIESVLQQRTNFDFELVIGDDCSPDRTGEIVREYAARYPAKIRTHFPQRNEGLTRNLSATIGMCRGQYVAWLEGDDFWTSSEKLQRQTDYLDANPDCAWCFTRAIVVDRKGQTIETRPVVRVIQPKYTLADYLRRIFQPRACTVMFRHRLFAKFPDWFYEMPTGDMPLHVLNAEHGDIGFIDEEMAAYRIHPGGVWSGGVSPSDWNAETPEQRRRHVERLWAVLTVYRAIDKHLGARYHAIAREQIARFAQQLTQQCRVLEDWPQMRRCVRCQLRSLPLPEGASTLGLLRAVLVSHLPFLARKSGMGL
ncbi:MAG TPA: glycosyltransferase [Chthoniobacteraceae bacterium]|jgi:glycosyltransferase involved in cell wall biosynthesis|nr:glycosyltransferase [Chthoniobacteraceae bacterium]